MEHALVGSSIAAAALTTTSTLPVWDGVVTPASAVLTRAQVQVIDIAAFFAKAGARQCLNLAIWVEVTIASPWTGAATATPRIVRRVRQAAALTPFGAWSCCARRWIGRWAVVHGVENGIGEVADHGILQAGVEGGKHGALWS